jgi:hypothetical protein
MNKTTQKTIQCPMIHMNGTSAVDLLKGLEDAYSAVGVALDSMRNIGPNGRDYYPLGPEAMEAAQTQHRDRALRLHNVREELEAIIGAIDARETTAVVKVRT